MDQRQTESPGQDAYSAPNIRRQAEEFRFSSEEKMFMQKMRAEAALTRGYPLGLVAMGLTMLGIQRFSPKTLRGRKWGYSILAGVAGNVCGKLSYYPEIIRRSQTDLPEESLLRKKLAQMSQSVPMLNVQPAPQQEMQFGLEEDNQEFLKDKMDINSKGGNLSIDTPPAASPSNKKFVSYQDLRNQHYQQQNFNTKLPPFRSAKDHPQKQDQYNNELVTYEKDFQLENQPKEHKDVRYNKYGDEIL